MCIIEFIGAPYSGKSYFEKKLLESGVFQNNTIHNYRNFFFCNLSLVTKLNIIEKNLLKIFCNKKREEAKSYYVPSKKKKSFFKRRIQNIINSIIFNHQILYRKENIEFCKLIDDFFISLDSNDINFQNLDRWLKELFASHYVYKNLDFKKKIIMDSEGFIHRLTSFLALNYDNKFLENYLEFCPKPNVLILVNEQLEVIKKRIKDSRNIEEKIKYKDNIEDLFNYSFKIFEKMPDVSTKKFIINSKNFSSEKVKIADYINNNFL